MTGKWTFGRAIAAGFAAVMALNLAAGVIALVSLRSVVASKDKVIRVDSQLEVRAQQLLVARSERGASFRGYLLSGDPTALPQMSQQSAKFSAILVETKQLADTAQGRRLADQIAVGNAVYEASRLKIVALRQQGSSVAEVTRALNAAAPERAPLTSALTAFTTYEQRAALFNTRAATDAAHRDTILVIAVLVAAIVGAAALAALLTRNLRRRIGSVVGEVQSSSTELQATANQQAVGAMEQATAMSEISTTITELLATSRQITDNARRVADTADKTATAGRTGQDTVTLAQHSMTEIRRQVDTIVNHTLELGDKSQRIGAVLDIVSELAEQTNILAINSTIEAAGAGESGKRFAVVADEIRKLADRVAESTKEVRNLIDVVRNAVHTTVLATEIGSKAVDAGTAQFDGVASAFEKIVGLVTTTTESAREIELSTKQQTTAVEQVNFAVANVTQTTRESETSSTQTLQTASQLSELSTKLRLLVEPATAG
jgi:methyl-accepting chemotaxis protein